MTTDTNWTNGTPLVPPSQYAHGYVPVRVQGANPIDSTQDTFGQLPLGTLIVAGASAANSAAQALAAAGIQNNLGVPATALPYEVTGVTGGVATGVGGNPGPWALDVSGGPPGLQVFGNIDSTGKVSATNPYSILNPGIATTNAVPSLSWPASAGFTTAPTAPTVTVGTIPVGRTFSAPSTDGTQTLGWGNNAGVLASAPFGGVQLSAPLMAVITALQALLHPNISAGTGLQITDARGLILTIIDNLGIKTAGSVNAEFANILSGMIGGAIFTAGSMPLRIADARGLILAQIDAAGKFSAVSIAGSGSGGGGTTLTSSVRPRIRVAALQGGWRSEPVLIKSNGTTQLTGTDRFSWTANANVRNPQFMFYNNVIAAGGVLAPVGNAVQMVVAVEAQQSYALMYPSLHGCSGQPISSGGKTSHYVGDSNYVLTDPVHISLVAKGSTQYYRVHKKVVAGQYWPLTSTSTDYTWGGVSTTDEVMGSTVTDGSDRTINWTDTSSMAAFAASSANVGAWQATAVIAEQITPTPVVMVSGDSIADGYGGSALGRSYITRGLDASGVAWFNCGIPGSTFFSDETHNAPITLLAEYVDHIIFHCGTNDIFSGAGNILSLSDFQAQSLAAAEMFLRPGVKWWPATIFPRVTSSDSFATIANQTRNTTIPAGGTMTPEALRIVCNNWLRDATPTGAAAFYKANLPYGAAQFGGIIDPVALVEKNSDGSAVAYVSNGQQAAGTGGYWPANGTANYATADGIHPTDAIQIVAAPAVPSASAFALT